MLSILSQANMKVPPVKLAPNQKVKTWKFAAKYLWKERFTEDKAELGRWTRDELLDLGPTFVKLGQIASTRGDLYPPEFTKELESLQDNVPPFDFNLMKDVVNIDIFKDFEEIPFKSASIGQVHKATLKNGKKVVVKLKRPGILNIMKTDTNNVKKILDFIQSIGVDTGSSSNFVLNDSIEYLLGEADYRQEVENAIKFRRSLKGIDWIKVPYVYKKYCTDDMIVMEYVEADKITEIKNKRINRKKVCEALVNSYVIQTMDSGLFHGDPHPGNLAISKDGKLVFYDFGLLIELNDELKQGFSDLFGCIINRDTKGVVQILIKLGVIVPTSSDVSDIEVFFETILGYLETLDGGAIMNDELAAELAMEKPFVVPTSFVYLAKSFSLIEGICLQLDPDFDYFTYLEPMIQEQFLESLDISEIIMNTTEIPSKIGKINSTVLGLERSRAAMKRSMIKTRQEIRIVQYSVICALLAERFNGTPIAAILVGIAIWITFRKDRSL
uniref:ABC1 atypical kinase-like domain-containing protein n=1 Tax=viral metagenome TaxID=1070528 RepID=A0A6C0J3E0_9ZZZZ